MNRTALFDLHVAAGGRMVDFAGWEMPLQYSGIIDEHLATRQSCTMFDVSHMGRLYLSGPDAEALLERLCTRPIASMKVGQCRYSHVCREDGGILDDVIVSRFDQRWLVVCNASNREKIVQWLRDHAAGQCVDIVDDTRQTVMVAIQGPEVMEIAEELLPVDVADIRRYHFKSGKYMGIDYVCSRTGYTGEDGFELILPRAAGKMVASAVLTEEGAAFGRIKPAGLGARDTLRLEAGMPLYGHELSESVNSISAGQSWCVDLNKEFIGGSALRKIQADGPARVLVGLELAGKRIARQGALIELDGAPVGIVTSGTFSPSLEKVIAMAFVDQAAAKLGIQLQANIRASRAKATVVPLPFYTRGKQSS